MQQTRRLLVHLALLLALLVPVLLPAVASAHLGQQRARIEGRKRPEVPRDGPRGRAQVALPNGADVLRLAPSADGLTATFEVRNVGDGPLEIFRVGFEVEDETPRAAAGVGVQSSARETAPLAPGEVRTFTVVWRSEQTLSKQLFGYLVVDSDGAAPNATEYDPSPVVVVSADRRPFWQRHILSWLAFGPLGLALLALASRFVPSFNERRLRLAAIAFAGVLAVSSLVTVATFVRILAREDGNWGLQHVERAKLAGPVEYFLGIDGLSAALVPLLAFVLLSVILASGEAQKLRAFIGLSGAAAAGATLFTVSQGMLLAVVGLAGFAGAAVALVWVSGLASNEDPHVASPSERSAARAPLLAAFAIGLGAFAWLTHTLSRVAEPGRRFDGGMASVTDALPEIARAASHGHAIRHDAATVLGLSAPHGLLVLAFIAFVPFLAAAPLHRWLPAVVRGAPASVSALVIGLGSVIGTVGLLRYTVNLFPEQSPFVAQAATWIGLLTLVVGGLRAAVASDVRVLAGHLATASSGIVLFALASMTPQGLAAALVFGLTRGASLALLMLVVGALLSRTGDAGLARAGGLGQGGTPRLAFVWLTAVLGVAGFGAAFFGLLLAIVGAVGSRPFSALGFGLGLTLLAAGAARALGVLSPTVPTWWRGSARLEPHGGVLPDLRGRELTWAAILLALMLTFVIAPRFWVGLADATILDWFRMLAPAGPTQVS